MSGDEFGQAIGYLVLRNPACLSNHASRFAAVGIFSLELAPGMAAGTIRMTVQPLTSLHERLHGTPNSPVALMCAGHWHRREAVESVRLWMSPFTYAKSVSTSTEEAFHEAPATVEMFANRANTQPTMGECHDRQQQQTRLCFDG
jgi:hypothetical protein